MMGNKSRLPAEYQEVEYIRNNGVNDAISLGITAHPGDYVAVYVKALVRNGGLNYRLGPTPMSYGNQRFWRTFYQDGTDATTISGLAASGGMRCQLDVVFEQELSTSGKTTNGVFTPLARPLNHELKEFALFACNSSAARTNYTTGDIYEARVTVNSVVWNYIPCYRKSDGACGFYNVHNNYFQPSWHNLLTAGPEV